MAEDLAPTIADAAKENEPKEYLSIWYDTEYDNWRTFNGYLGCDATLSCFAEVLHYAHINDFCKREESWENAANEIGGLNEMIFSRNKKTTITDAAKENELKEYLSIWYDTEDEQWRTFNGYLDCDGTLSCFAEVLHYAHINDFFEREESWEKAAKESGGRNEMIFSRNKKTTITDAVKENEPKEYLSIWYDTEHKQHWRTFNGYLDCDGTLSCFAEVLHYAHINDFFEREESWENAAKEIGGPNEIIFSRNKTFKNLQCCDKHYS